MTEKKWAVIEVGGKQHLVAVGSRIVTNRAVEGEGETVTVKGMLDQSPVELRVSSHLLGPKINGLKFKNKIRYLKRYGHRQKLSTFEIISIGGKKDQTSEPVATEEKVNKKTVKSVKLKAKT